MNAYSDVEYGRLLELGVTRTQADSGAAPVRLLLRAYERAHDAQDTRMLQFLLERIWKPQRAPRMTSSMTLTDEELERRLRA